MLTAQDCVRAAYQALLRGDTAERDRLCRLAQHILDTKAMFPSDFLERGIEVPQRGTPEKPIKLVAQPDGSYAPETL